MEDQPTVLRWLRSLHEAKAKSATYSPNYWTSNPSSLLTTSTIHNVTFGTGHSIYENSILPAIETAEREVILVTCFWAKSPTLDALNNTLQKLSAKGTARGRKIKVRICFSSSSLFQKLFHTFSLCGHVYLPHTWQRTLGLPSARSLSGLDMEVKSVFVLPFSVMHPKFVIIDRRSVLLPSCNVSWENWFEGCIEMSGSVVEQFVKFWERFWAEKSDRGLAVPEMEGLERPSLSPGAVPPQLLFRQMLDTKGVLSIILPSPHHRSPKFVLPWRESAAPPPTPLNSFLLSALSTASSDIYLQTPNLTAAPVLSALLAALKRGVNVTIVTSERLMILEQLVTAGTTTSRCVKKLIRRHKQCINMHKVGNPADLEAGYLHHPGRLRVSFFHADPNSTKRELEPVQSHLKFTMIDAEWTIFGSGNMDRASWYTSQELDVAFFTTKLANTISKELARLIRHRSKCIYDN